MREWVEEEVDGGIIEINGKKNSPSMTIALPPLVPMSMPRYKGAETIAEPKRTTERLPRSESERKVDGLIDKDADVDVFFLAPRTPVPRLVLPEQQQRE